VSALWWFDLRIFAGYAAPVVNVHVWVDIGLPAMSRIADVPPVKVTRYCTLAARLAFGFTVNCRVVVLKVMAAGTAPPLDTRISRTELVVVEVVLNPCTTSLMVAVTLAFLATPVAADAGDFALIVGRGPVMKVQVAVAMVLPAPSSTPETDTV
jgi:hypothetical protein